MTIDEKKKIDTISNAWATIEELSDHLPMRAYDLMHEGLCELIDKVQWQSKPELIRRILPILLEDQIAEEQGVGAKTSPAVQSVSSEEIAMQAVDGLNAFTKNRGASNATLSAAHALRDTIVQESWARKDVPASWLTARDAKRLK